MRVVAGGERRACERDQEGATLPRAPANADIIEITLECVLNALGGGRPVLSVCSEIGTPPAPRSHCTRISWISPLPEQDLRPAYGSERVGLGERDLTIPAQEYAQQHRANHQPRAEPAVEALLALIKMLLDLPPIAVRTDIAASLTTRTFVRPLDFDLAVFAERAFGLYQNEREYGEVVWRFYTRGETVVDEIDGSLTIRFRAAGHLEMAWHLYQWGDAVEVLAPDRLRAMVEAHRRSDFAALP